MLELLDAGIDKKTQATIEKIVTDLVDGDELLAVRNVRGVKCGGHTNLDLTIDVPPSMTVRDSHALEQRVRDAVMSARREVREVKFHVHSEEVLPDGTRAKRKTVEKEGPTSDFGRDGC
ncbi:hypothetical protein I307_04447 [Cryptococcus deuterogattii 99/473]|uniref:Cation efflux protein cytoplasmic domain-containing protein n=2 Tax=Cryptococcus gattii species complex TaxID=1884637 RepID=A0A0D0VCB0_9TREE|nr:hypothetical protein I352_02032 [Cryptococcus deuterogattii MMRL2647]KIR42485.1 hypothetical protein I313_01710 [Cryptococcus deuterogattii Ram5]KIR72690.1 hypothetical protein I310_03291 [Cryptococcus deuterogattii CA1014]KIY56055.1 hypothetical protein I307_04447 [Cryptococcus deuterogattii 99/473]